MKGTLSSLPSWAKASLSLRSFFFFQAEDGIRDLTVTGVQTCALPISLSPIQRGVAAAQHVGHVHALRLQFSQATGFGFAGGITAAVRWRTQGVQMETADRKSVV